MFSGTALGGGEGGRPLPNHHYPDGKKSAEGRFWTVKTGRKAGFYRPINSQSFQMVVMQYTVQTLPIMEQNSKNFRAFGAIHLHISLFR